jgi:hypothetical protein
MNANKLVPLTGVGAVAAIVAAFLILGETPDADAPLAEVVSFYTKHDSDAQFSGALLALGALLFLVFSSAMAGVLRRAQGDNGGPAAVSYAGGIMFAVGVAIFAGLTFALGDAAKDIEPGAVQSIHVLNEDLFFPVAVGVAAFMFGSGIGVVKTGALPKWLGWVAIVIGIVALTPGGFAAFMLLGLWTLVASVMLSMRADSA